MSMNTSMTENYQPTVYVLKYLRIIRYIISGS